jgi:hypothetical protein
VDQELPSQDSLLNE